jgi:hypothetical protein
MARLVPSDLTRLALAGAHQPEIVTLAYLRKALPDDHTVFHGVHWTRQYKGTTWFGEIDFVVVNRARRVLCIEQKNGPLVEEAGKLFKQYPDQCKNVGEQVARALDNIREKFKHQLPDQRLEVDYLIYCPDHAIRQLTAAAIDRERVVDAPRRDRLADVIQTILPTGAPDPAGVAKRVEEFFCQTFEVVPDVHAHVGAQEKNFVRLSGGLVEVLDNIEMTPLRLRVLATAGNGKTFVARHFFDKALAAGRRPLLLCFNRPLKERLKHLAQAGGLVETWYGFCDRFLKSRGHALDFRAMQNDPGFWPSAAQRVSDLALADSPSADWLFDTLIVDEAQDFEGGWLEILRLFLRPAGDMLWLEDPNQSVRRVADAPVLDELGFVGYRSMLNYRSPLGIAEFIRRTLPDFAFTPANDLPGLGVGVSPYADPAEQPKIVGKLVGRLLGQRFEAKQIAVLSCRGRDGTALKDAERFGNYTISRFGDAYDMFGNQEYTKGQILFDTVRRFKGQQEAAVILTDVDPRESRLREDLMAMFCGMTRATVRLDVVCNGQNPWIAERLNADEHWASSTA